MTVTDKPVDIAELLQKFIAPAPATAVIPDEVAAQARELDQIREVVKTLKAREDVLRPLLNEFLDTLGADSVAENGVSISRNTHTRANIDREALKTHYPKVLADVTQLVPVTQLRVEVTG